MPRQAMRLHEPTRSDGLRHLPAQISSEHANIARLAYLRWLERGGPIGSFEEDWSRAERDLKNEQTRQQSCHLFSTFFSGSGEEERRGGKDVVMKNSREITTNGIVPVLSISPMEEDHFFLQNTLDHLQGTLDPSLQPGWIDHR